MAAAAALQRVGISAIVLEQGPAVPPSGTALGLWTNAWRALDALGAGDALRAMHIPSSDIELCREDGRVLRRFSLAECDGGPHEFRGVRRANLTAVLADTLQPGSIEYGAGVASVSAPRSGSAPGLGAEIHLTDERSIACAAVIGADGVRSAVGSSLGRKPANYAGQVAIRGIARFPAGVPCDCIRQVWGPGVRAGLYPISSTELYWFVCMYRSKDAAVPPSPEAFKAEALQAVRGWAGGMEGIIEATPLEDISRSRIVDRWDLPPLAPHRGGVSPVSGPVATLAGDALHPMTPNLGQGGCTALEDAVVVARLLQAAGVPELTGGKRTQAMAAVFREYEAQRARRCLPLTVRAYAMGALLQLPLAPVVAARDAIVSTAFNHGHFLDHAAFDCGKL